MENKKIVVLGVNLKEEYKKRLQEIGEVSVLESPTSVEDFLNKVENAEVIYSNGAYLLDSLSKLKNVFITYMNLLITGGCGFIGSNIVEQLITDKNIKLIKCKL